MDIGVHIGGFSYSALTRGAGRLFGFEAEPSNFDAARENLRAFGDRVTLVNKAVWRSDRPASSLAFTPSGDPANTGGGSLLWGGSGRKVETVPFDDVLDRATNGGRRRVAFLKIDCEGSEFPILLTSKKLHLIDTIAGEFHETSGDHLADEVRVSGFERFTVEALARQLRGAGFEVTWRRQGDSPMGLFFARRPAPRRSTWGGRLKSILKHLSKTPARPAGSEAGERIPR